MNDNLVLHGKQIRLEPLTLDHASPLLDATRGGGELYAMSFVPQDEHAMRAYIETALAWARAGTAVPFVTIRRSDGAVLGSTRFFDLARWSWPSGHPNGTRAYDTCEIGYTWLAPSAIKTPANTEAKLLMLTHAFESWSVRSVCFHADRRNARSRAAIERIGAQFEGILRAHRLASDFTARDSARYSIVSDEWPMVKAHLAELLARE